MLLPSHRKFLLIQSNFFLTDAVIKYKDMYSGKLDNDDLISVILLPKERYCLFHVENFSLNFSTTESHIAIDLGFAPIYKPRY